MAKAKEFETGNIGASSVLQVMTSNANGGYGSWSCGRMLAAASGYLHKIEPEK